MKRAFKLAIASIAILFVVVSLLGALLPSVVLVSRAVNVERPRDSIRYYLNDINRWADWVEGMRDSSVKIFSPTQAKLGRTAVAIQSATDSTITSTWTAGNGSVQQSLMRLISDSAGKITVVQWQFEQKLHWYPWEKFGSIMNDKVIGTMMEKNLNHLKDLAEKKVIN